MDDDTTGGTIALSRIRVPAQRPLSDNVLIDWLLTEGLNIQRPSDLVARLGHRMVEIGMPLCRLRVTLRTLHPQYLGTSYTWTRGSEEVEEFLPTYEILLTDQYLKSPYAGIFEGAGGIRRRLDVPGIILDFPILEDLRDAGATDYIALPLLFSDGKINALTLAADRPGGFTTAEIESINRMVPLLAQLMECHALRRTATTILETYLGRLSGARVLKGLIKRGDGENIHALIWFSDLRGSTRLADRIPRQAFLHLLNDYFECMAGAVLDHGGEVLRFIGDAALAIFPIGAVDADPQAARPADHTHVRAHQEASEAAIEAARDAVRRVAAINAERQSRGDRTIGFGIGLHLGEVLYGNIGTPRRLEFSVVGAAANEAARIESMTKVLDKSVLISEAVAQVARQPLVDLGSHALRGVSDPQRLFTLPDLCEPDPCAAIADPPRKTER
jgi:adenylate cyclase